MASTYLDSLDLNKTKEFDGSLRVMLDRLITEDDLETVIVPEQIVLNYVMRDLFTGSGALGGHVADVGAGTWTDADGAFALSGGSAIQNTTDGAVHKAYNSQEVDLSAAAVKEIYWEMSIPDAAFSSNVGIIFLRSNVNQEEYWIRLSPNVSAGNFDLFNGIIMNIRQSDGSPGGGVTLSDATSRACGTYRFGLKFVSAAVTEIWIEPSGGGARTVMATWTQDISSRFNASHCLFGLVAEMEITTTVANWLTLVIPDTSTIIPASQYTQFPYDIPNDPTAFTVLNRSTGAAVAYTWVSERLISISGSTDLSALSLWMGFPYTFEFTLTTIYPRDQGGNAKSTGRLQLGYLDVDFGDTRSFSVTVTPLERTARTSSFDADEPSDGKLHVAVLTRNEYATIKLHDSTPKDCHLYGINWEGEQTNTRFVRGSVTVAPDAGGGGGG